MESSLSELQEKVLDVLAGLEPAWTLTGGGALAGFHLGHRRTEDLDLFFHGLKSLDTLPLEVEGRLSAAGLEVRSLRSAPTFRQMEVRRGSERVVLDLVADPVPTIVPPREIKPGIWVDAPQEILVNKLCALLGRVAIRDLLDVHALVAAGADLEAALDAAPRKDGGFSRATLAWLLHDLPVEKLATQVGYDVQLLKDFREHLVKALLA